MSNPRRKIDGIYQKIRRSLDRPEVKRGIKWTTGIGLVVSIILSFLLSNGIIFLYPQKAEAATPTYQAKGTFTSGAGALSVPVPAGYQDNDVFLLFVESANEAITTPSGWTEVANSPQFTGTAAAAGGVRLAVFYKVVSGAQSDASVADTGNHQTAITANFRGVKTSAPIHLTAGSVDSSATSALSAPSLITTVDNALIVNAIGLDKDLNDADTLSGEANASLSSLIEQHDQTVNTGVGGGLAFYTGGKATAGSIGNTTATGDTSTTHAYVTVALEPAPSTITVGTTGTQTANMNIPSTNQYVGGAFTFIRNEGSANVTVITISETDASLSAQSYLTNVQLYYKQEASCSSSIPAGTTTFNATGVGFNASEKAAITGDSAMVVGTSQICVYVELDVVTGAPNADTFDIEITNPSTEVTVSAGVVSPATAVAISGSTQVNLAPAVKQDHYRWRNDDGPEGDTNQTKYFNPIGNGYGAVEFSIVSGCTAGSEWDCVHDGSGDTQSSAPTSDLETSQLLLAAATDYYTLADDALPAGVTITQLDITVAGADDIGNPNTSITLGYCIVGGANDCGTADTMGSAQAISGADQTKTEQFTGLSLSTTNMNNMQLVIIASGVKAEISTLYVLITYLRSEATWAQLEDTPHTNLSKTNNIRLRFQVDNTGGAANNYNYRLEWAARGADSSCDTSYSQETYYAVPDTPTTEHFDMTTSASSYFVDGDPTTAKLSNGESYTFVAGDQVESTSNQSGNISLAQNEYSEIEYVFQANTNATDSGVYCLRVTNAGTALNSADVIAQVTLSGGAGNQNPNSPSSLLQKKVTGGATLATGDWTNETQVQFTATASDPDNPDTLYLCVEKDPIGTAFSNTEDSCGSGVAYSGTPVTVTITISSQTDNTEYHWQARVKDNVGAYSGWVCYDTCDVNNRDYGIDTSAPTSGTVYDGTSGDQDWNDGSLTSLSSNWTGFDATVSGLNKYEYAVRRSSDSWYWNTTGPTWQVAEAWYNNGATTSVTVTPIYLNTGENYYFSVKTYDNAGNIENPVSSNGQQVSPTLSFSLSGNTVTFADLNNTNSWTDTKTSTTTTSTNAYSGYTAKAYITQLLTSLAYPTVTIPNFSYNGASWASPQLWPSGQYGFGYTSSDTLVQGLNRFAGGTQYAPFSQTASGDVVADHTAAVNGSTGAVVNEVFTITYKVAVSQTQAASAYQTYATYIVTANY